MTSITITRIEAIELSLKYMAAMSL